VGINATSFLLCRRDCPKHPDLGKTTMEKAKAMTEFSPDDTWKPL
jgi:hypothetical protein